MACVYVAWTGFSSVNVVDVSDVDAACCAATCWVICCWAAAIAAAFNALASVGVPDTALGSSGMTTSTVGCWWGVVPCMTAAFFGSIMIVAAPGRVLLFGTTCELLFATFVLLLPVVGFVGEGRKGNRRVKHKFK